jgi:predicted permease
MAVSSELFDVLEARPQLGRTFRPGEDLAGTPFTTVISHSLWQELGGDPGIVGKVYQLGGLPREIVGVMPAGFWFPSPDVRMWSAAKMSPQGRSGSYTLVGRAGDGVAITSMDGQMRALGNTLAANFRYPPQWDKTKAPAVTPAREFLVGDVRPSLLATLAAMAVILLIACANVAALMLGQVDARSIELAVRAALGANRRRIVQQVLLESLLIGLAAGAAGALLAASAFTLLAESLPLGELAANARLDWTVFGASIGAALAEALLVALVPGIALWRHRTIRSTMATSRTGGIAGRGGRLEGGLVIAQMALAVLLAAGAGLLIRRVANLRAIDAGVNVAGVAIVDATLPVNMPPPERRRAVLDMLSTLEAVPGVTAVGAAQKLPLRGSGNNWGISIIGKPDTGGTTAFRIVSRGYLKAMGLDVRKGRDFDSSDRDDSDPVVIINEALAAKHFPNEDPIGRAINTGFPRSERIIGVVENAAEADLQDPPVPARYMLIDQLPYQAPNYSFVLRTSEPGLVPAAIEAARSRIAREGTRLAVQETTSMQHVFDLAVGPAGQIVTLLSLLAGLALVLGAIGVYGVISHYVTRRSRDYGICLALGERPARVIRQVVLRGASLVAIGSALGIAAALYLTKLLTTLLYGVEATDPLAMIAAVAVLLTVGVLAAFVPARRASRMDPMTILRE